jgi:hypothetical protein
MLEEFNDRSLLRRIDFDDYGEINPNYRIFNFHSSIRNYLDKKLCNKAAALDAKYGEKFARYYCKMLYETYCRRLSIDLIWLNAIS